MYRSIRQIGDIDIGRFEIVTPAPQMPMHEQDSIFATARATLRGAITSVVPPPPSVNDLKNTGWQHTSTLSAATMQVVPPPPLLPTGNSTRGTQEGKAIPVVPPPPSVDGLKNTGGQYMSTLSAAAMPVVLPRAIPRAADNATSRGPIELSTPLPGVQSPREAIGDGRGTLADTKELSVSFIGPVLPLPSSSYFSSREVFIAEERLSRHQSRLIKLIYDFLPYQPRLSDYGPNYPAVDKLRATRDPTCDETLMQVMSPVSTAPADRLQLGSKYLDQRQSKLACFRTTADDYRKARARQHK